jgi:hypothetical protein
VLLQNIEGLFGRGTGRPVNGETLALWAREFK